MPIYHAGQPCYDLRTEGDEIQMLIEEGRVVYMRDPGRALWKRIPILTKCRMVEENGVNGWEKWFDFGMELPTVTAPFITGNSGAGWSLLGGLFTLHMEQTENLVDWNMGRMLPAPVAVESDGNPDPDLEILTYWARSFFPRDSRIKTGQLVSVMADNDPRRNPITYVKINGVLLALARYPYSLPTQAGFLAEDLAELGFLGATVISTAAGSWEIRVPNIALTSYDIKSEIGWPMFLVPNMYGNVVNPCGSTFPSGSFVNSGGVRTGLDKQFARVGLRTTAPSLESAIDGALQYFTSNPTPP